MNKTIKNVLIFGIPTVIIIVIIIIVIKEIRGEKSKCPPDLPYTTFDGTCLQCDPQDPLCAVCTEDDDCKNNGTCYKDESTNGNGVCICTSEFSGLHCEKYCTDDSDCHGGKCTDDGQCICTNGNAPPDCKNPPDRSKCHPDSNCNSILITQMQVIREGDLSTGTNTILQIMCDEDLTNVDLGKDGITLDQFPKTWGINGAKLTPTNDSGLGIPAVQAIENIQEKCWYYCEGGGTTCPNPVGSELPGSTGFWPPVDPGIGKFAQLDRCNPPVHAAATCFHRDCPKYSILTCVASPTIKFNNFPLNSPKSYQNWLTSAYFTFTPDPWESNCYNHSVSGTGDKMLCESCHPPWGPGKDVMDDHFGPKDYPLGICGRRLNDYPIQIAAGDSFESTDNTGQQKCQSAFGNSSCYASSNCRGCHPWHECRDTYAQCNTTNFYAIPGSNCQTGTWNACHQCSSTDGQNEQTAFYRSDDNGGCGAVPDSKKQVDCSKNVPAPKDTSCCDDDCYPPVNLLHTFPPHVN